MTTKEIIRKQVAALQKKQAKLIDNLRQEFPKMFAELLAKSKRIESIGWKQYTDYFNDGDECRFRVHNDDTIFVNGLNLYEWEDEEDNFITDTVYDDGKWVPNPNLDKHEAAILSEIQEILSEIPSDFYFSLFGDHASVTLFKDGRVEVNEYTNHD